MAVAVRGLRELTQTFSKAPKDVKRAYRAELRTIADPVKTTAEALAVSEIPRIGSKWSKMRIGRPLNLVYVAPKQRGIKGADPRKRGQQFANLLADRAMDPALEKNRHRIEHDFDRMLDKLVNRWDD